MSFLGGGAKSDEIKDEVTRGQSGQALQFKPLMKGETEAQRGGLAGPSSHSH